MLSVGAIPKGAYICHRCDNPKCCNPAHLWAGTQADNVADMIAKGRRADPTYYRGEDHKNHILSAAAVMDIRVSKLSHAALGEKYGVSDTTISLVKRRLAWAHIP